MPAIRLVAPIAAAIAFAACGSSSVADDSSADASVDASATDAGTSGDASTPPDSGPSLIERLMALTAQCSVASNGRYATDQGATPTIDICRLNGAFFWKADMDIDCDGKTTPQCNRSTDPSYSNQTSVSDSQGNPLDAANLPFIVLPLPGSRFDFRAQGIKAGAAAIVLYDGQLAYGVFGDVGPSSIIGEASYAMAKAMGIDPSPTTGGVDSGVTYLVFTGAGAVPSRVEDPQEAAALGQSLAEQLLGNN